MDTGPNTGMSPDDVPHNGVPEIPLRAIVTRQGGSATYIITSNGGGPPCFRVLDRGRRCRAGVMLRYEGATRNG